MGLWSRIKAALWESADERLAFLRLARRVAERVPGLEVVEERPEEFELHLRTAGGAGSDTLYLANLFHETRGLSAAERRQRLEQFLADTFSARAAAPLGWVEARDRLRPVLRASSSFLMGDKRLPVLQRPFVPFVCEAVVIDSAAGMRYVAAEDVARWDVDPGLVFTQAGHNLADCADGVAPFEMEGGGPLWQVAAGDSYESSRLLLPGWLASFAGRVPGPPVAIVPDRGTVVVGGGEDPAVVGRLLALAEEVAGASRRRISTVPYTVDGAGRVVPLGLEPGHPAAAALAHARHLLAGAEYANQKEHLEAVHQREGTDLFVASYGVIRGKDGRERSYATWGEGIDTLLPRTDILAMGRMDGEKWLSLVPWEDVERIAGGCLQLTPDCDPPRHRTVSWPGPEQIAELRARGEPA